MWKSGFSWFPDVCRQSSQLAGLHFPRTPECQRMGSRQNYDSLLLPQWDLPGEECNGQDSCFPQQPVSRLGTVWMETKRFASAPRMSLRATGFSGKGRALIMAQGSSLIYCQANPFRSEKAECHTENDSPATTLPSFAFSPSNPDHLSPTFQLCSA